MNLSKLKLLIASFILLSNLAHATIGTNDFAYGIINKGMAGSGAAYPQDAFVAAQNPAGLAFIENSRFDLGLSIFSPIREYKATATPTPFAVAPNRNGSSRNVFFIPSLGYVAPKLTESLSWGIVVFGNGGMNTEYKDNTVGSTIGPLSGIFGVGNTGVDFQQMYIAVPVAYKLNDNIAIGLDGILAVQALKFWGLGPFAGFSVIPTNLTDRSSDYSYGLGVKFSAMAKLSDAIAIAGSYQPKIIMTRFDKYAGLLPFAGTVNIPPNAIVGLTLQPNNFVIINLDYQRYWFSEEGAYSNPFNCVLGRLCLGIPNGTGFGWINADVYRIGGQLNVNENWQLRAGFSHNNQIIPPTEVLLNIIAPAVTKNHITLGVTRFFENAMAINMNFMYSPNASVTGSNPFNPNQTITLKMHQYDVGFSLTWFLDKLVTK
jgi:long-chain fatty acid transport protein